MCNNQLFRIYKARNCAKTPYIIGNKHVNILKIFKKNLLITFLTFVYLSVGGNSNERNFIYISTR